MSQESIHMCITWKKAWKHLKYSQRCNAICSIPQKFWSTRNTPRTRWWRDRPLSRSLCHIIGLQLNTCLLLCSSVATCRSTGLSAKESQLPWQLSGVVNVNKSWLIMIETHQSLRMINPHYSRSPPVEIARGHRTPRVGNTQVTCDALCPSVSLCHHERLGDPVWPPTSPWQLIHGKVQKKKQKKKRPERCAYLAFHLVLEEISDHEMYS